MIRRLLSKADRDKDNKLVKARHCTLLIDFFQDIEEFTSIFIKVVQRVQLIENARRAFEELDVNRSGYIQVDALRKVLDQSLSLHRPDGANHLTKEEKEKFDRDILSVLVTERPGQMNLEVFALLFDRLYKHKLQQRRQSVDFASISLQSAS